MKIYPTCLACGRTDWGPGGGSYGAIPQVSYARCTVCGAALADIYGGHFSTLILVRGVDFPDTWINEVVIAVMRRRDREADAWRNDIYAELFLRAFGVRQLPEGWRWDPDKRVALDRARREHQAATGQNPDTFEGLTLPPPVLARVPSQDIAWVWVRARGDAAWTLLDPEATKDLPLPIDPIREASDASWAALDAWHAKWGFPLRDRTEIENQYDSSATRLEPWYQWKYRHILVTAGPRRRVFELSFAGVGPNVVDALRALADRDDVTFVAEDSTITIHAWDGEKVQEYLKAAYDAVDA